MATVWGNAMIALGTQMRRPIGLLAGALALLAGAPAGAENTHPGAALYEQHCAICHDDAAMNLPPIEALRQMGSEAMFHTLTSGKMQAQASTMEDEEILALLDYISGRMDSRFAEAIAPVCRGERARIDVTAPVAVGAWGMDKRNRRHQPGALAGLSAADLEKLELAWALGFPATTMMRSQPVIVGSTLFLLLAELGRVFALDAETGCLKWTYAADRPLRTALNFGEITSAGESAPRKVLYFGDVGSQVHMIDAGDGALLWEQDLRLFDTSIITGAPVLHGARLYVPISSYEISKAARGSYPCCRSHGAVAALEAGSGEVVWLTRMTEPATRQGINAIDVPRWGPSGAPVWTTPAIDEARGVLYVGTGENTSAPATDTSDAIIALDLETGDKRWVFQATAQDLYNNACGGRDPGPNCPTEGEALDFDFGASVVIAKRSDGSDILLAGQKSGTLWALDPDAEGSLLWHRELSQGTPLGGIHWGLALEGDTVFVPVNDPAYRITDYYYTPRPGIHAIDVTTGETRWSQFVEPDCRPEREARLRRCAIYYGLSGAPLSLPGAVLIGSLDGYVRAFDSETGDVLWTYDTTGDFETLNGVEARGGAIDNSTIVAAGGMLYVQSGYAMHGQTEGNVFLAFRPRRSEGGAP